MKIEKIILTILTLTIFVPVYGQNEFGQIPIEVKQKADSIINVTLGTDYYKRTTFQCENSLIYLTDHFILSSCQEVKSKRRNRKKNRNGLKPNFYALNYRLNLNENSNYDFEIRIDKNLKLKGDIKLPDCKSTIACAIKVDSLKAIDLAIKSGLEKGLGIYNDGLILDNDTKSFQWVIKNHLKTGPDRGDLIYIDSQTGERIQAKDAEWLRSVVH